MRNPTKGLKRKQIKTEVMSNMSYCRFENTSTDVQDCLDAIHNEELSEMSEYEIRGFLRFVSNCKEVAEHYENYDQDELKEMIEKLQED